MNKLNYKLILIFVFAISIFSACKKDFLERTPGVALSEDDIFADPVLAAQFGDKAYVSLIDDYARFDDHRGASSQASDEAVSGTTNSSIRYLNQGLFHDHSDRVASLNDIRDVWSRAYAGIRVTNVMLARMNDVPWPTTTAGTAMKTRIRGEMNFVRAFLYFELIKRFGGVPLISRAYKFDEDLDLPRSTYQQTLNFILADLELAIENLPADYDNSNYGRATRGAARALKARALLYAASALNNPTNDLTKWAAAAAAAMDIINPKKLDANGNLVPDVNPYSLQSTYSDILNVASSSEYIMMKIRGPRANSENKIVDFSQSPGSGSISGSMDPTQNHVDLYEMKNGKGIFETGSGYNPQAPYTNRDPRLGFNVLYNDQPWQGRKLQMWDGGRDYLSTNTIYTATRYYCRKYWPEPYIRNVTGTALLNFVYFRYAEVLLNYAEAINEADPINGATRAKPYIDMIRARTDVNMPPLAANLSQDDMRKHIRNERAVELAFEDHRWYDIMRWRAGTEIVAKPVYGMNVVRNSNGTFVYNPVLLPSTYQKVFLDHMHRYPIPRSEVNKSNGILIQNPGW